MSFIKEPNPAAIALMTKMKIAPRDRPKVKLECLRLLTTLKLDPARTQLIGVFVKGYLTRNAKENVGFERAFAKLDKETKEATMEVWTSWGREGMEKGMQEGMQRGEQKGKEDLVARQLRKRLGSIPAEVTSRLDTLAVDQLNDLGEAFLEFKTLDDLENWLAHH